MSFKEIMYLRTYKYMYIKVSHSSPNLKRNFMGNIISFYFTMKVCGSSCNVASGNLIVNYERNLHSSIQWVMIIDNSGYSINEPWNVWQYGWVVMSYFIYLSGKVPVQLTAGSGFELDDPWNVQLKSRVVIMAWGNCYILHVLV